MKELINALWILVQVAIGYNLFLPLFLYILYLVKKYKTKRVEPVAEGDYGIIVTAYEQVTAVPEAVNSLLKLNHHNFLIYIVADKCDVSSLKFDDERVIILRPEETLASNTRSHFYAINRFRRPHNRLTIIDSDNLTDPEYLNELDKFFAEGFEAVQGVREAKNLNTTYARLDAARDIYYHFYDGKVLFNIGSSATLAGSGMAFTTQLYRECLEYLDVTGAGFDKVLQHAILSKNKRIAFAEKAIVYDEKTTQSEQLVKQRSRWINTWFKYFRLGFGLLVKGSWNQFVFGLILLRPPLFIFLLLSVIFMVANIWISITASLIWLAGFIAFVLGFAIALASSPTDKRIYQSLVNIPKFIFFQVLSLLKVRKANKYSVATTHYYHGDSKEEEVKE
ncbi:glycosyltransferase family 2 protein [Mucilaginibacter sp. RS28]|uniref:Glycosyltransferase family 2 protein n=1 Tax=Mucilaginibacter straminoryzae TaxID=2932774 RepID=A0A9X1X691_9SPHI|nr:glycosyltransferase [Mucilaginibacter straminoryzae]MCJ8211824.1 glycosyltransferase family 2 protein [Mucilaginibacter straminoryzae]